MHACDSCMQRCTTKIVYGYNTNATSAWKTIVKSLHGKKKTIQQPPIRHPGFGPTHVSILESDLVKTTLMPPSQTNIEALDVSKPLKYQRKLIFGIPRKECVYAGNKSHHKSENR